MCSLRVPALRDARRTADDTPAASSRRNAPRRVQSFVGSDCCTPWCMRYRSNGAMQSAHEKKAGLTPCSKNCVDPVCPANRDLILIGGVTLLLARQGSSRDLDHQTLA